MLQNRSKYVNLYAKEGGEPLIRLFLWSGKGTNPIHYSPPLIGDVPWMITILQRKDSPYKDSLTLEMLRIDAAGLFRFKYMADSLNIIASNSKLDKKYQERDTSPGVSLLQSMVHFLGACLLLLILSAISFAF